MDENWMQNRESSIIADVDSGSQFGAIGRQESRKTSELSPQALQSFLTNAPIPRMFYTGTTSTHTSGSNITVTWSPTGSFDPYNMLAPSTGIITIPIDGFYIGVFNMFGTSTSGAASVDVGWMDIAKSIFYAHVTINDQNTAPTLYVGQVVCLYPFRAGTNVLINIGNGAATTVALTQTNVSLTWAAPYTNYQGGQN